MESLELLLGSCVFCEEGITSLVICRFLQPSGCLESNGKILVPFI